MTEKTIAYIDFDSCYYNLARAVYGIAPWTIITNKFNHVISTPHWMEGHFGVEKIAYIAPPTRIRLKARRFVSILNIDAVPRGRDTMTERLNAILEDIKVFAPDSSIMHKDSIVVNVEDTSVDEVMSVVVLPCTVGVGCSVDEAKSDCKMKKAIKRRRFTNIITLILYTTPMVVSYLLYILRRRYHEDRKDFRYARPNRVQ